MPAAELLESRMTCSIALMLGMSMSTFWPLTTFFVKVEHFAADFFVVIRSILPPPSGPPVFFFKKSRILGKLAIDNEFAIMSDSFFSSVPASVIDILFIGGSIINSSCSDACLAGFIANGRLEDFLHSLVIFGVDLDTVMAGVFGNTDVKEVVERLPDA